jgi:HEAT repeat protein
VSPAGPPAIALLCGVLTSGKHGAHRAGWLIGDVPMAWHERVFAEPSGVVGGADTEAAAAVLANKDAVLSAVADPDARVRAAAAFALAWAAQTARFAPRRRA